MTAAALTALAGCSEQTVGEFKRLGLPEAASDRAPYIGDLWIGTWIAAGIVGIGVWGLIGWCVVAYRRRRDDNELPVQLRYNVPLEILYTIVPIFMIAVFFFYTARDQTALLDTEQDPAVTVNVAGVIERLSPT